MAAGLEIFNPNDAAIAQAEKVTGLTSLEALHAYRALVDERVDEANLNEATLQVNR